MSFCVMLYCARIVHFLVFKVDNYCLSCVNCVINYILTVLAYSSAAGVADSGTVLTRSTLAGASAAS